MSSKNQSAWVFFVPPSWMLVCILDDAANPPDGSEYVVSEGAYVESVGQDLSIWDCAHNPKAAQKSWPLASGTCIRRDGVLVREPAQLDVARAIVRASDKSTIRSAK